MEILAGNELTSGGVVYLDPTGRWVQDMQAAWRFGKDDGVSRDKAIADSNATTRIVSVEVVAVSDVDGLLIPLRMRERIRAKGPTTRNILNGAVFDRQHLNEDGHVSI
ncbi:DUF2849 domain-containing protein [Devosia rhodophyticola]|uniref:DUF2849 domain-containing protein n=1 Tax=Devosia rhodophyticola TaxID=3026423 RepID=A0ABY7YVQ6_9HYPH|nr:DUF2849 domain-containing protein [Devosia rhodophyticola]WDR05396.1 DUF2849 domain-containing protein [Devosia rhodophyticola]